MSNCLERTERDEGENEPIVLPSGLRVLLVESVDLRATRLPYDSVEERFGKEVLEELDMTVAAMRAHFRNVRGWKMESPPDYFDVLTMTPEELEKWGFPVYPTLDEIKEVFRERVGAWFAIREIEREKDEEVGC